MRVDCLPFNQNIICGVYVYSGLLTVTHTRDVSLAFYKRKRFPGAICSSLSAPIVYSEQMRQHTRIHLKMNDSRPLNIHVRPGIPLLRG